MSTRIFLFEIIKKKFISKNNLFFFGIDLGKKKFRKIS